MPSRRSSDSDSSRSSSSSSGSSRPRSPSPEPSHPSLGILSSSALVLVNDDDDPENDTSSFSFSDDDDLVVAGPRSDTPLSPSLSTPSSLLSPSVAFIHILSPCLKLGAIAALTSRLPLQYAVPALLSFSAIAVFTRQIWFLLARYVRKADLADIAIEAFTKKKGQEGRKNVIRESARWGTILTRWLLAVLYLRASASTLTPILPHDFLLIPTHTLIVTTYSLILLPFILAKAHASRRLTYLAWVSVAIYIAWLCSVIYGHNVGSLDSDAFPQLTGILMRDIPLMAFAFSTASSLQLYAGVVQPSFPRHGGSSVGKKERRYQAISMVSLAAGLLSTVLVLPLVFPRIKPIGHELQEPGAVASNPAHVHTLASVLTSLLLLSGIPVLIATAPVLPLPLPTTVRQRLSPNGGIGDKLRNLSKCVLLAGAMLISVIVPGGRAGGKTGAILSDLTLVFVLTGTFFLPAILHITLHVFRRPLSIVVPPSPLTNTSPTDRSAPSNFGKYSNAPSRSTMQRSMSSASDSDLSDDVTTPLTRAPGMGSSLQAHPFSRPRDVTNTPRERTFKTTPSQFPSSSSNTHLPSTSYGQNSSSNLHVPSHFLPPPTTADPITETLLQRKERALQRRRVGRRLFFDIGVWLGLMPLSVGGFVWVVGRISGAW